MVILSFSFSFFKPPSVIFTNLCERFSFSSFIVSTHKYVCVFVISLLLQFKLQVLVDACVKKRKRGVELILASIRICRWQFAFECKVKAKIEFFYSSNTLRGYGLQLVDVLI